MGESFWKKEKNLQKFIQFFFFFLESLYENKHLVFISFEKWFVRKYKEIYLYHHQDKNSIEMMNQMIILSLLFYYFYT